MLHTDIPTEPEFRGLDAERGARILSLDLSSHHAGHAGDERRSNPLKNLVTEAISQLEDAKANKRKVAAIQALLMELHDDDVFWAYLADGLAVFGTPDEVRTLGCPISPPQAVEVSDRFHIKPLVPLMAFPGACFVLALAQGATRFIEVASSLAEPVKVDGLPKNMSDALKKQLPRNRAPIQPHTGSEGMKVLTGQYCRIVDRALRPILTYGRPSARARFRGRDGCNLPRTQHLPASAVRDDHRQSGADD